MSGDIASIQHWKLNLVKSHMSAKVIFTHRLDTQNSYHINFQDEVQFIQIANNMVWICFKLQKKFFLNINKNCEIKKRKHWKNDLFSRICTLKHSQYFKILQFFPAYLLYSAVPIYCINIYSVFLLYLIVYKH